MPCAGRPWEKESDALRGKLVPPKELCIMGEDFL